MRPGDEFGDPDHPGLRIRRTNAARVFFYRYRASDCALREIKLGEFGPMTLAEARHYCQPVAFEGQRLSLNETVPTKSAPAPSHRAAQSPPAQLIAPETPHFKGVFGK